MLRSISVAIAVLVVCLASCTRARSKATCGIGGSCWECPSGDAAMQCLSKLDGAAAGCKPTDVKNCR